MIMRIAGLLAEKKTTLSFEFFPPKKQEMESVLFETIGCLSKYNPDFVSITYGAGGSTRDKTLDWTRSLKNDYNLNVMMHLTCIAQTAQSVDEILAVLKAEGVDNILALRGDLPSDMAGGHCMDFAHASDLIAHVSGRNQSFSIGCAGYPEGHIEAPSLDHDVEMVKRKVDAGAEFIITQLFFDNNYFYNFLDKLEKTGVRVPVVAGIMPITNIQQVLRFTGMCGSTVPNRIVQDMYNKSEEDMLRIGVEYASAQCIHLIETGVSGIHFYTLNRSSATELVLGNIASFLSR